MRYKVFIFCLTLVFLALLVNVNAREREGAQQSFPKVNLLEDIVYMDINNIDMPMKNDGANGEDGQGYYPNGTDLAFLFSGGMAASGYIDDNGNGVNEPEELRTAWITPASLIEETQPGNWAQSADDPRYVFYVVNSSDGFGSEAYLKWADAVAQGADWVNLDGDPTSYDPMADRPDILADRTVWCVYNDGTTLSKRNRLQTLPLGLEVRQQAWAFARSDALGDVVFIRYRFTNALQRDIKDLIFTLWTDPDLGNANDDLIGCDTTLSMGYIYNDGDDDRYGGNPPAFGIDFFQGPVVESPGDTAYRYRGPLLGVDTLYDWKNLPMTSFMYYINGDPTIGDPNSKDIARYYQVGGLIANGNPLDPTIFGTGATASTDPRYVYNGDPVTATGWRDNVPADKRFMVNTGPFQLPAWQDLNGNNRVDVEEPGVQDIVVAYIVTRGASAINSVAKLRATDDFAQLAYNANFLVAGPPPAPVVDVRTADQEIELIVDLHRNGTYRYQQEDDLGNLQTFEGVKIYQFASRSTQETEGGLPNRKLIALYDLSNGYNNLYVRDGLGQWQLAFVGLENLNPADFTRPGTEYISFKVTQDAFNNNTPLINGKEYFFTVTSFSINLGNSPVTGSPYVRKDTLGTITGNPDNWLATSSADLLENSLATNLIAVRPQSDEVRPFRSTNPGEYYTGTRTFPADAERGFARVDVIRQDELLDHNYQVSFFEDGQYWRLTDQTLNQVLADSVTLQANAEDVGEVWNFPIIDGFSAQVYNVPLELVSDSVEYADLPDSLLWMTGRNTFGDGSVYNNGITLVRLFDPTLTTLKKSDVFPVRLIFQADSANHTTGYRWAVNTFTDASFRGPQPIPVTAYDITDPNNPRQLNICFNNPAAALPFSALNRIYVMTSNYDPQNAYVDEDPGDPSNLKNKFISETYLVLSLEYNDSLRRATRQNITVDVFPSYSNSDVDTYTFNASLLRPVLSQEERQSLLDRIKVVPNPYFAYSTYETSYDQAVLRFTHLDREVTIRIFNLAGQLVRTLTKNNTENQLTWDLRNEARLKVASGMYIAHVEVPGVGDKILKFAIIQREERIDQY
ncbi:MAG: T9SS type A sorting domain-containing protein [Calditrichaceae bacterium]|nr:hypothetical protein [Calditrichia bacterium]NUQ42016.1 T9SS type A sorting domain-containing protein [Calditrichaceae bacterium]